MSSSRRYKLLCPIARALDRVGDRWTLLILRDLHAGPARFSDLQTGLTGIAANLLTDRLRQLIDDGLIERRAGDFGVALYALTALGKRSRDLLFELAMFGARFPPAEDLRRPGNLRTVAVTLEAACQRVVEPAMRFDAELVVDGERFTIRVAAGLVEISYAGCTTADVVISTAYEPLIAVSEGAMGVDAFVEEHLDVATRTAGKDEEAMALLGAAVALIREDG